MKSARWVETAPVAVAILAGAAIALAVPVGASSPQPSPLERLRWMAGCWERSGGDLVVEEHWLEPRGGVMLGVSRTIRGDRAVAYEFLRIAEREDGDVVLWAQPSGQALTEFRATALSDTLAAFHNPEHDFPQRVIYRPGPDSLFARIEGTAGGRERAVDFRMARVRCPAGSTPG